MSLPWQRRALLLQMTFGPLALVSIAHSATKNVANGKEKSPELAGVAPLVSPGQLLSETLAHHFLPLAQTFETASQRLLASLQAPDSPWSSHRAPWVAAMTAWETLNAVPAGPLLERRSARAIDFWPTRPAQIQTQLAKGVAAIDALDNLDTVGTTAKGLPALEWLLYQTDGGSEGNRAGAHYAVHVARQVLGEARALLADFQQLATNISTLDKPQARALYGDWYGQAIGALEQLRLKKMSRPLTQHRPEAWHRPYSGQTAAAWRAQWAGMRRFLMGTPAASDAKSTDLPAPGSLNGWLRGEGFLAESAALQAQVKRTGDAIAQALPGPGRATQAALRQLETMKAMTSQLATDTLAITTGFTDADGD